MPGEAIVPTEIAQDNRFKPLVEALVTGKIAKYGDGTTGVKVPQDLNPTGRTYNAKTARGAEGIQSFINSLQKNLDGTYNYIDPKGEFSRSNIPAKDIANAIQTRSDKAEFELEKIKEKLSLNKDGLSKSKRKKGETSADKKVTNLKTLIKKERLFDFNNVKEADAIKQRLKEQGLFNQRDFDKLIQTEAAHIKPSIGPDGKKVWDLKNVVLDKGYVNNFLSNNLKGNLGKHLMQMPEEQLRLLGIDKNTLESFYGGGTKGSETHPVTKKQAKTLQAVARYVVSKDEKFLKSISQKDKLLLND
jgi:hypothetical protein